MANKDQTYMEQALKLARISAALGEVPVGSLVVLNDEIIGTGINRREMSSLCFEHAEINAIRAASLRLGNWRLTGAIVYSTLEPCIMCAGAMLHARIDRLVYGACDPKFGAIDSLYALAHDERLNHRFCVTRGVLADSSAHLLQDFFCRVRKKKKADQTLASGADQSSPIVS